MNPSVIRQTVVPSTLPATRELYQGLLRAPGEYRALAARFLDLQLQRQAAGESALPDDPQRWPDWLECSARRTATAYAEYLRERRAGAARRHFRNRAQALYFLQAVQPTKAVDGAWLLGLLQHWDDPRALPLLQICLEELGHGNPARNHVLIYRRLLGNLGCDSPLPLSDDHFLQGTLQLAFACLADDFLPELLGYNLGYETPPLHLLITSFELQELGIDPHYFRLHVTIDNASSGHGRKALQALRGYLPRLGDRAEFLQRVQAGFALNDLGLSCRQILDGFDLQAELLAMLERKRPFARQMHADRSRIGGRSVNQWLAGSDSLEPFLQVLEREGWVIRNADPARSRLWRLVSGDPAPMFGVFTPYERQLLYDWIAQDWSAPPAPRRSNPAASASSAPAGLDFVAEERALLDRLGGLSAPERMAALIAQMAPHRHWTPAGLLATRLYAGHLGIQA
ncbi:iron-containing redox enzyme family protein [Pseudomonas sp. LA21]|uniref:iron-containing redox enzyme family protein n=1 Tax=Pseudomonas sp. LA21 TaxID=2893373 RepID=UPI001FB6B20C|nr:iron-containing redox enzyme family protein [Pseudomonas sp. LA21]MCJ1886986.1 iron-containing redox enzyme family protein [Pseudomonas sp. LA21]